ncbi:hypothetical protein MLD38_000224 [Melastoma candidum]|uniref:Uncharacterized protein n=1 Tax=Melastoma candidum TaxID=119954 RepID=A0ACB9SAP6_9MYRT|nr:hypothetical protein MLD38_000224 [Melastoma candidum]
MGILPVALVPPPVALPWIQRNISSSDTVATSWVVLKHSTCGSTSTTVATVATSASTSTPSQAAAANAASEKDKRQAHKRKFQELPVEAKEPTASNQESKALKPGKPEVERSAGVFLACCLQSIRDP